MAVSDADRKKVREHLEICKQLKSDFSDRDKLFEEIDNVLYMKKDPRVPRGFPNTTKVKSPLATHIVNTVTAALSMNPYLVRFDPVNIGPSGEQNASLREHFHNAGWQRQEREKKRRIYRAYMHAKSAYGEGCIKTIERSKTAWAGYDSFQEQLRKDLADEKHPLYGDLAKRTEETKDLTERDRIYNARTEEKKREMPFPIESTDVPPGTFYPMRGEGGGFSYVAEIKAVPYFSTLQRYGKALNGSGKVVPAALGLGRAEWVKSMEGGKSLTMHECWDCDEVFYILCGPGDDYAKGDGEFVKKIKHGYGDKYLKTLRGPYFHSYGITTSSRENHLMGLSVLFGWLKLFPWLDELLTIQGAAAYQYGYPRYQRKNEGADDARLRNWSRDSQDKIDREETFEPGDILPWGIAPVDAPSSGPDLGEAIKICRDLIELCLPAVVQGLVNGDESGYLAAQATHLARLIWQPIVENAEFCLAERTSFEAWLIDQKIGERVYVWGEEARPAGFQKNKSRMMWLGLGPDEIKGVYNYGVKLQPSTPSQDVIKVRNHGDMLAMKLETLAMAQTDMGFNPEEVEMGNMLADLKAQLLPSVIEEAKARILAKRTQQMVDAATKEMNGGLGGANNGRMGAGDVIEPGQGGEPIQPTPAGQAGVTDVSAAGGIAARPVTTGPVQPGIAPASAEQG